MSKRLVAVLLVAMMAVTMFAGCGPNAQQDSTGGSTKQDATVKSVVDETKTSVNATAGPEPETIDPTMNNTADGSIYISEMFEGLTRRDAKLKIVEGVANKWEVSADGLKYTFHIRDDAKWSDGQPIKAQDFEYSWRRAADPKTAAYYSLMMSYLVNGDDIIAGKKAPSELGVKATDEKTLEVSLKAPCIYFLELMAFPVFSPLRQDIIQKSGAEWTQSPETYVSNGPYKLSKWEHNSQIVMVKNDNYWDKSMKRHISTINWKLSDDFPAMLNAYEAGELDYNDSSIPPEELPNLIKDGKTVQTPEIGVNYVSLNVNKAPLNNPKVRKALSLALDRKYLVEKVMQGGQKVSAGFIPYNIPGFDEKMDFRTEVGSETFFKDGPDIEGAKKLLEEAGYPEGKGLPEIEYSTNSNSANNALAEAYQAQWAAIGVKVKINSMEWKVFGPYRTDKKHQIARDAWSSDYMDPMSFLELLMTGNPNNNSSYSNPDYDKLCQKIYTTSDIKERAGYMHQAEKIILEDSPIIPTSFRMKNGQMNPKLKGVTLSPLGYVLMEYANWEK